ncbi:hypothetical protein GCM10029992_62330 [Glycomyces albus]
MPICPARANMTTTPPAMTVSGVAAVREKWRRLIVPSLSRARADLTMLVCAVGADIEVVSPIGLRGCGGEGSEVAAADGGVGHGGRQVPRTARRGAGRALTCAWAYSCAPEGVWEYSGLDSPTASVSASRNASGSGMRRAIAVRCPRIRASGAPATSASLAA